MGVALRAATPGDTELLFSVYASTRAAEVAALGLGAAAATGFLRMQFRAQDTGYRAAHPDASIDVVVVDGVPAGRLWVDRRSHAIHVLDIALAPEHRGRGVGSALLRGLLAEGAATGRPVTLSALRAGRALTLYARLGFVVSGGDEMYVHLRADPPGQPKTT